MDNFNHAEQNSRLVEMCKKLEYLIDQLLKTRVRCHILEVELCTQFSPYLMEAAHNAQINCEECSQQFKVLFVPSREQQEIDTSLSSNLPIYPPKTKCDKTTTQNIAYAIGE